MLDAAWEDHLSECPVCGDTLFPSDAVPRTVEQIEIIRRPIRIDEHRGLAYLCQSRQQVHYAPLPPEVQKGRLFGPELTSLVAYMKDTCHASFSTIRKFLRDVLKVTVSRGYLRKLIAKVTESLEHAYEELLLLLPRPILDRWKIAVKGNDAHIICMPRPQRPGSQSGRWDRDQGRKLQQYRA